MFPGTVGKGLGKVGNCVPSALFADAAFDMDWFVVVTNFSLRDWSRCASQSPHQFKDRSDAA
jgi:hypothetical protein